MNLFDKILMAWTETSEDVKWAAVVAPCLTACFIAVVCVVPGCFEGCDQRINERNKDNIQREIRLREIEARKGTPTP